MRALNLTHFKNWSDLTLSPLFALLFILLGSVVSCQSGPPSSAPTKALDGPANSHEVSIPGAQPLNTRVLEEKGMGLDGQPKPLQAIASNGLNRKPIGFGKERVLIAGKRLGLDRWQIFEADLSKNVERRVTFDAGDSEPLLTLNGRLVFASTGDEIKSSQRVLSEFQARFLEGNSTAAGTASGRSPNSLHHLFIQPANNLRSKEFERISNEPAPAWSLSADTLGKQILALNLSIPIKAYRIGLSKSGERRTWIPISIERANEPAAVLADSNGSAAISAATPSPTPTPSASPSPAPVSPAATQATATRAPVNGVLMPDGTRAVWTDGRILWTTNTNGKDPKFLSNPGVDLLGPMVVDPLGQWIVFVARTEAMGANLMALDKSGRCLKQLTNLPGDELDPAFSPDGKSLLFAKKEGDNSIVVSMPIGEASCSP